MIDLKDEYRIQVDNYKIPDELLIKTKNKMQESCKPMKHLKIRTIVIAAALIVCMGVTTFAYEYHQHQYKLINNNAGGNHEYLSTENETAQVVDETDVDENISATMVDVKADENNMYITVVLKTKDGSDININNENCVTVLERQGFDKAYFVVDGLNVDFTSILRTDDGSDATEAVFELRYTDTNSFINANIYKDSNKSSVSLKSLKGKDIQIVLENYKFEINIKQSIDFTYSDIGTMLQNTQMADASDFSDVGISSTYANGTNVYAHTLNAGNKKIYFTKKYPKTYIDNIGIYETGGQHIKQLYVSIVPENAEVRAELLTTLQLFNIETGAYVTAFQPELKPISDPTYVTNADGTATIVWNRNYVQPDDGRIVLIFNAAMYVYNEATKCNDSDTTLELLNDFVFTSKYVKDIKTVDSTWDIDFNLEKVNPMLIYEPNKTIQKSGTDVMIEKVAVSDSYVSISGSTETNLTIKSLGNIYLILNDGTKVDIGNKLGGGYEGKTGKIILYGFSKNLVDADKVTGIEIWGNVVNLK